jgi:hypothetical protein
MGRLQSSAVEPNGMVEKKPSRFFVCGGMVLAFLVLAGIGFAFLLGIGFYQVEQSPKIIEVSTPPDTLADDFEISAQQMALTREIGWPQSFAILFYTVDDDAGKKVDVRDETWTYYDLGKSFQFINGKLTTEGRLPIQVQNPIAVPYKPEQFHGDMDLDQLVKSVHLQKYLEIPLEKEVVPDSRLYYANMLTFAMQNGRLRYVETLALEKEAQP